MDNFNYTMKKENDILYGVLIWESEFEVKRCLRDFGSVENWEKETKRYTKKGIELDGLELVDCKTDIDVENNRIVVKTAIKGDKILKLTESDLEEERIRIIENTENDFKAEGRIGEIKVEII